MARMNFSAINGLPVVDVSTGVRAGEARTFSVTFKCGIKGLLVERGPDHIVLVEPSRILGMGTAAAVIDLDENAPRVPCEEIGRNSMIGRPVISMSGEPAGQLLDCAVDLEMMEIGEFRLLSADQAGEYTVLPEQIRTLGLDYIILEVDSGTSQASLPEPEKAADNLEEANLEIPELVPVMTMVPSEEVLADEPQSKASVIEEEVEKTSPEAVAIKEEIEDTFPRPGRQAQIDALVNKSLGRTLAVDKGGERIVLQGGTVITREMAEDLADNTPLFLETLPLFVK